jgi:nucleotide-binding universal stress UspA family protein
MEHILITTDLSKESYGAFGEAQKYIDLMQGSVRISLLTVIETPILIGDPADAFTAFGDMEELLQSQEQRAKDVLAEIKMKYFSSKDVACHVVRTGVDAAQAIVDFANQSAVTLMIMSTHGRKGFRRFFLGSVTDRVLRYAQMPILVVPIAPQDG